MITFQYPIVLLQDDDPENSKVSLQTGRISPINLSTEPYEATVHAEGCSFHILFGHQCNGMFLCIPNWHTGSELTDLSDISWNLNALLDNEQTLNYEESTAVVYALRELKNYL